MCEKYVRICHIFHDIWEFFVRTNRSLKKGVRHFPNTNLGHIRTNLSKMCEEYVRYFHTCKNLGNIRFCENGGSTVLCMAIYAILVSSTL